MLSSGNLVNGSICGPACKSDKITCMALSSGDQRKVLVILFGNRVWLPVIWSGNQRKLSVQCSSGDLRKVHVILSGSQVLLPFIMPGDPVNLPVLVP